MTHDSEADELAMCRALLPNAEDLARVLDRAAHEERARRFLEEAAQNPRLAPAIAEFNKAREQAPGSAQRSGPSREPRSDDASGAVAAGSAGRGHTLRMIHARGARFEVVAADPANAPAAASAPRNEAAPAPAALASKGSKKKDDEEEETGSPWQAEGLAARSIDTSALPSAHAPAPARASVSEPKRDRRAAEVSRRYSRRSSIALVLASVALPVLVWLLLSQLTSREPMAPSRPAESARSARSGRGVEADPPATAATSSLTAEPPSALSAEPVAPSPVPTVDRPAPAASVPTPTSSARVPGRSAPPAPPPARPRTAAPAMTAAPPETAVAAPPPAPTLTPMFPPEGERN